jgi:predicted ribosomally synthesized peptide with SipW-like signal peptide
MNRRVVALGAVAALALSGLGAGTYAWFVDVEVSAGQVITAATLDLELNTSASTPDIDVETGAPGDSGSVTFELANTGSLPGELSIAFVPDSENENGCEEPERLDEGGSCGADADLDANLDVTVSDGPGGHSSSGKLTELIAAGDLDFGVLGTGPAGSTAVTVDWTIPSSVDNRIQGDSVAFHLEATLDQIVP